MNSLFEKSLSGNYVEKVIIDITGKIIMLIIGLIIGYYIKISLF